MSAAVWAILSAYFQYNYKNVLDYLYISLLCLPTFGILLLYRKGHPAAFIQLSYLITGLVYICIPMLLLYICAFEYTKQGERDYNYKIVIGILVLIWGTDTFAYFTGKFLGKHKLFPRISPNKTWEGFIGGVIGTLIIGILLNNSEKIFGKQYSWESNSFSWIVVAIIASVVGLYGDLVESMLKRNLFVKDSGSFLPGHGGILDRFDSVLFAMPILFMYIYFAKMLSIN